MTTPQPSKEEIQDALDALDVLRNAANGYNSLLRTGYSWGLDKTIRRVLENAIKEIE